MIVVPSITARIASPCQARFRRSWQMCGSIRPIAYIAGIAMTSPIWSASQAVSRMPFDSALGLPDAASGNRSHLRVQWRGGPGGSGAEMPRPSIMPAFATRTSVRTATVESMHRPPDSTKTRRHPFPPIIRGSAVHEPGFIGEGEVPAARGVRLSPPV